MCTALVSFDPGAHWPILVAFVRDEDRDRATDPPSFWWPQQPGVLGGHDQRAGGTWLAVDVEAATVALLLNRLEPALAGLLVDQPISRGSIPLRALEPGFDPHELPLAHHEPFHLARIDLDSAQRWRWDGAQLEAEPMQQGVHLIASRGADLPGEPQRHEAITARFATTARPVPSRDADPVTAWGDWIELLDGRDARPDDFSGLVVQSVSARPNFGTVGATLVGIAADGHVRYDVNTTPNLDPHAWTQVETAAANVAG